MKIIDIFFGLIFVDILWFLVNLLILMVRNKSKLKTTFSEKLVGEVHRKSALRKMLLFLLMFLTVIIQNFLFLVFNSLCNGKGAELEFWSEVVWIYYFKLTSLKSHFYFS